MRIEQLEYLLDIAKTKSITKTAENYYISRQVVSSNIRMLEKELGVPLLVRNHNNFTFTPRGELAVEKAQIVVDAYHDFMNSISPEVASNQTDIDMAISLTIFTIPRLLSTIIPDMVSRFKNVFPKADIRIASLSSQEILYTMSQTKNAIGFISYPDNNSNMEPFQLANYPDLTVTPFMISKFYICVHKNSRYSKRASFNTAELATLPLISYAPAYGSLANQPKYALNVVSSVNDLSTLISLVKQDLGVGLITLREYNFLNDTKNLILIPIVSNINNPLYFAYVLNTMESTNVYIQKFIKLLHAYQL